METTPVTLVYNPAANYWLAHGEEGQTEDYLHRLLAPLGIAYTLVPLTGQSLAVLEQQISATAPRRLWVAGGDGSILALLPIAQRLDLPLGILPAGTMNLLARDLGISLDLEQATAQLVQASVVRMDVALVNQKPFLCISNLGFSTLFTRWREKMRHSPAWIRWPKVAWKMAVGLFKYRSLRIIIEANGQPLPLRTRALAIANNPLSNQGSWFPTREALNTGQLAIYTTQERAIWSLPRLYSRLMRGDWQQDPELHILQAPEVVVHIPRRRQVRVMRDGELAFFRTPLHYQIGAQQLQVLAPEYKREP